MTSKTHTKYSILLVSNYSSDTRYAWWLMEHFWLTLHKLHSGTNTHTILTYPKIKGLPDGISSSSIRTLELDFARANVSDLYKFIKKHNINSIYLTDQPFFSLRYLVVRLAGVKKIIVHDHTPGDRPDINGIFGALKSIRNRIKMWTADAVLNVSPLMQQRSIKNGRIPKKKCFVVQNGIVPISRDEASLPQTRSEFNIPHDTVLIISTGRAHPYKQYDFIINVAEKLNKQNMENKFVFLLVGDGPDLERLKDIVQTRKLEHIILLPGFRQDIHKLLLASDIAIHAAKGEGFSLSITEYMSAGLPVIVPDTPSVSQAIDNGVNGYIYKSGDILSATSILSSLIKDRNKIRKLGNAARTKANNIYTLDRCSRQFIHACKTVLSL